MALKERSSSAGRWDSCKGTAGDKWSKSQFCWHLNFYTSLLQHALRCKWDHEILFITVESSIAVNLSSGVCWGTSLFHKTSLPSNYSSIEIEVMRGRASWFPSVTAEQRVPIRAKHDSTKISFSNIFVTVWMDLLKCLYLLPDHSVQQYLRLLLSKWNKGEHIAKPIFI